MSKKIFVLLGHPDKVNSSNAYFADQYEKGAREAGHEVRRTNISDLQFDPIMHDGYRKIQALEPDLMKVQEDIKWAEHIVVFYPTWWSSMPALLKGLFDRMWLPGFAYNFIKPTPEMGIAMRLKSKFTWIKRLTGRTGRIFITSDTHPLILRAMYGDTSKILKGAILGFGGISPVAVQKIGPLKNLSQEKKESWGRVVYEIAKRGA